MRNSCHVCATSRVEQFHVHEIQQHEANQQMLETDLILARSNALELLTTTRVLQEFPTTPTSAATIQLLREQHHAEKQQSGSCCDSTISKAEPTND